MNLLLLDVTPLTLGIQTTGGVMKVLIPRDTTLPTKKSQTFATHADYVSGFLIQVYEDEGSMTNDCHKLGQFNLDGLAPAPRVVPQIEVSFEIDVNCILNIHAVDKASKKSKKITIENKKAEFQTIGAIRDFNCFGTM